MQSSMFPRRPQTADKHAKLLEPPPKARWQAVWGLTVTSVAQNGITGRELGLEGIRSFIKKTGRALPPPRAHDRPHPHFLRWHRENCFKQ